MEEMATAPCSCLQYYCRIVSRPTAETSVPIHCDSVTLLSSCRCAISGLMTMYGQGMSSSKGVQC